MQSNCRADTGFGNTIRRYVLQPSDEPEPDVAPEADGRPNTSRSKRGAGRPPRQADDGDGEAAAAAPPLQQRPERPSTARIGGRKPSAPEPGGEDDASVDAAAAAATENPHSEPPPAMKAAVAQPEEPEPPLPGGLVKSVRRRERPSSARPAPPQGSRADSGGAIESTVAEVAIIDGGNDDDDDDDEPAGLEGFGDPSTAPTPSPMPGSGEDDGEAGALMRRIQAMKGATTESSSAPPHGTSDATRIREAEATKKEVDSLRETIQTLCRSANPLGKIVDYVQEDVDSMRKELLQWQNEQEEHANALAEEATLTDDALQPVRVKLADLDQQILDQIDMNRALSAITNENDAKISKMVESVTGSN